MLNTRGTDLRRPNTKADFTMMHAGKQGGGGALLLRGCGKKAARVLLP